MSKSNMVVIGFCLSYSRGEMELDYLGIMDNEKKDEIDGYMEEMGDIVEYSENGVEEYYGEEVGYVFVKVEVGKGYELRFDGGEDERMKLTEKEVEVLDESGVEIDWEEVECYGECNFAKIKLK